MRYWLVVFPRVSLELWRWRRHALCISDPLLRELALDALAKRSNIEGAAAFAAIGPWRHCGSAVRALVAFQALYNHADMLTERFACESIDDAREMHGVLLLALDPGALGPGHDGGSRGSRWSDDDGYVASLIAACHAALLQLPSYPPVLMSARRAAERIIAFQSLSVGAHRELEFWARSATPPDCRLQWWETAASAGSSLGVHALIAAAASPALDAKTIAAIDAAYSPTIGALHSLLDGVVDVAEDRATGQLRLLDCYPTPAVAAVALADLARAAQARARELPRGRASELLVAAMTCSYLGAPEASHGEVEPIAREVRGALGWIAAPLLLVFRLRRLAGVLRPASTAVATPGPAPPDSAPVDPIPAPIHVDAVERSADARAA